MISKHLAKRLKNTKNLLAFSGGADSTALFFLLQENGIPCDLAIVDYGMREQSKEEVAYAKELARKYDCVCYVFKAAPIAKNFEATARKVRYGFFSSLIEKHRYDVLLTAHHLGDKLEWFLMRFVKGAGCIELNGMQEYQERNGYVLIRPLLNYDKADLLAYLQQRKIRFYHDISNDSMEFERNRFRKHFAQPLLKEYKEGIKRSFAYIQNDAALLEEGSECTLLEDAFICSFATARSAVAKIDRFLKHNHNHLLTAAEKEALLEKRSLVVGRKFLIVFYHNNLLSLTPYTQNKPTLPKPFKERCRKLHIPPLIRSYLFLHPEVFKYLEKKLK